MKTDYPEIFIENVRRYMTLQGMSMRHAAKLCKVSPQTVSNLLAGNAKPTLETMTRLSDGLGVSLSMLLLESMPDDMMTLHRVDKLVMWYMAASKEGRGLIYDIAKHESSRA